LTFALAASVAPASATGRDSAATTPRTFGVQPAHDNAPDARAAFTFGVTPGATVDDEVAVLNFSTKPLVLGVYATDAFTSSDGGFSLLTSKQRPRDAGAWVSLGTARQTVHVPARSADAPGEVIVPFRVTIPANASPGDHAGGIIASLKSTAKNNQGANVTLDQRVASRLFIRVSGPLHPGLTITDLRATYDGGPLSPSGAMHVSYIVSNTGNVKLGGHQQVSVRSLIGPVRHVAPPDLPLLLPGSTFRVQTTVQGVWPAIRGRVSTTVVPLQVTGDADPTVAPLRSTVSLWTIPWLLLLLVVALVATAELVRRRRKRPSPPPTPIFDRTPVAA
jgi:hypothetical protein